MPKVQVNDIEIYYEIHGEGPPLLMITGYGGNLDGWDTLAPRVEKLSKNYKVITLDNRGTGRTSKPDGPYSVPIMADDIAGLLNNLSISKTHVLGSSMGGMIAQEVAIRHPEKVFKLVLVCTSPGGIAYNHPKQSEVIKKLSWAYSPPDGRTMDNVMEEMMSIVYYPSYFTENKERIMAPSTDYPTVASTFEKQFNAIMNHNTVNRLESSSAETLVIHGMNDLLLIPEGGRMLADKIPNADTMFLSEAGHAVLEEKWYEIYPKLVKFLGDS